MRRISMMAALATLALGGCATLTGSGKAQTLPMQQGQRTPAAAGSIAFKANEKGNNEVTVQAKYLPIPSDLSPGTSTYVVWLDAGRGPVPVGTLDVAGDKRDAELKTSTPFHDFQVLVTAENQPAPAHPSHLVILRGQVGSGVAAAYGSQKQESQTQRQQTQRQQTQEMQPPEQQSQSQSQEQQSQPDEQPSNTQPQGGSGGQ